MGLLGRYTGVLTVVVATTWELSRRSLVLLSRRPLVPPFYSFYGFTSNTLFRPRLLTTIQILEHWCLVTLPVHDWTGKSVQEREPYFLLMKE